MVITFLKKAFELLHLIYFQQKIEENTFKKITFFGIRPVNAFLN